MRFSVSPPKGDASREKCQPSSKKGSDSLWHRSTALFQEIPSNPTVLLCMQPSPGNRLGHWSWQCLNLCIWKTVAGEGWGEALNSEIHIDPLTWEQLSSLACGASFQVTVFAPNFSTVLARIKWSCICDLGIVFCCKHSVNKALF